MSELKRIGDLTLIGRLFCFYPQGGPGSAGAKGESGDPGPQVRANHLLPLYIFIFSTYVVEQQKC